MVGFTPVCLDSAYCDACHVTCTGVINLRGQLSQICDVYVQLVKLTFDRIASFHLCLLIGPFYANLNHQMLYHDFRNCLVLYSGKFW